MEGLAVQAVQYRVWWEGERESQEWPARAGWSFRSLRDADWLDVGGVNWRR